MKSLLCIPRIKKILAYYLGGLYKRLDKHNVFLLSGGLTFSILTCILPLILIIFSILGMILETPSVKHQIDIFIENLIPYHKSAEFFKDAVLQRIREFSSNRTLSGYLGAFGLFFASSGLFSSMRTILNTIFNVQEDKHILIGKLRDFGMVFLVVILFLLSIMVLPALNFLLDVLKQLDVSFVANLAPVYDAFIKIVIAAISFVFIFLVFTLLYYLIPYEKMNRKTITMSAFWAALLWEIAKQLFGYYITHAVTLTRVYGTYIFLVAVVFWIYYSSIVFMIGAEIGELYREGSGPGNESEAGSDEPDTNS